MCVRLVLALVFFSWALTACEGGPAGSLTPGPQPTITPSSPLNVTPSSVQLNGVGAASAQNISVQESGYAGAFRESDTCSGVATVAASTTNGPSASYAVTGVSGGTCSATFSDLFGQTQTVGVSVTTSGFSVQ